MFAGRYLWWVLTGTGIFIFAALGLDHIAWLTIQLSGCEKMAGACEPTIWWISRMLKPGCIWIAIGMLFKATLVRLHYLSLLWFWGPVAAVWFVASTPFLLFVSADTAASWPVILAMLPVPLLFLAVFIVYLMVPFEDGDARPLEASAPLRLAARLTAVYSVLAAAAFMPDLSRVVGALLDMPALSVVVALAQPYLRTMLTLGTGSMAPAYVMLALFIAALAASLLPQAAARPPSRSTIMPRRLRR